MMMPMHMRIRNAGCRPSHLCDCHMANHSAPMTMNPIRYKANAMPSPHSARFLLWLKMSVPAFQAKSIL
jgi:hypothetical protein